MGSDGMVCGYTPGTHLRHTAIFSPAGLGTGAVTHRQVRESACRPQPTQPVLTAPVRPSCRTAFGQSRTALADPRRAYRSAGIPANAKIARTPCRVRGIPPPDAGFPRSARALSAGPGATNDDRSQPVTTTEHRSDRQQLATVPVGHAGRVSAKRLRRRGRSSRKRTRLVRPGMRGGGLEPPLIHGIPGLFPCDNAHFHPSCRPNRYPRVTPFSSELLPAAFGRPTPHRAPAKTPAGWPRSRNYGAHCSSQRAPHARHSRW
jgi:hypothetical protein